MKKKCLARLWSDERGLAAIELALVAAVILVPLFMGATEIGRRAWMKSQLDNAARAGLEYALGLHSFNASSISSVVHAATSLSVTATPVPTKTCMCPSSSGLTPTSSCAGTCPAGGAPGSYVTVTASTAYTSLFHSCGPLIPTKVCPLSSEPSTVTSTAIGRLN
jgi:Flp pilus assembly pilin Flp